jgi:hypothetical protein
MLSTSSEFMCVPFTGPAGVDLTAYPVSLALVPDSSAAEPADADYKTASWLPCPVHGVDIARQPSGGQKWGGEYPPGSYLAYARCVAGAEDVRKPAGRVRIGDVR